MSWWTHDLTEDKVKTARLRRKYKRAQDPIRKFRIFEDYKMQPEKQSMVDVQFCWTIIKTTCINIFPKLWEIGKSSNHT